jgi:hypothetical protein
VSRATVVHNQVDEYDVYIGRAVPEHGVDDSKWGNPFVMADDSDAERERAINAYREWVVAQPELMSSLEELCILGAPGRMCRLRRRDAVITANDVPVRIPCRHRYRFSHHRSRHYTELDRSLSPRFGR